MDELREKVNFLIEKYSLISGEKARYQRLRVIKEILKDEKCFWEMKTVTAYKILKDLEFENYKDKYKELSDLKKFL